MSRRQSYKPRKRKCSRCGEEHAWVEKPATDSIRQRYPYLCTPCLILVATEDAVQG